MSGRWSAEQRARFTASMADRGVRIRTPEERASAALPYTPCGKALPRTGHPCRLPEGHAGGCRERIKGAHATAEVARVTGLEPRVAQPEQKSQSRKPQADARGSHPFTAEAVAQTVAAALDMENALAHVQRAMALEVTGLQRDFRRFADEVRDHGMLDMLSGIRGTVLRLEDKVALLAKVGISSPPSERDPKLVDAMRSLDRRLRELEGRAEAPQLDEVLTLLRRLDSRPARVIEYRADHKREADGGTSVRTQRAGAGLPKRRSRARPRTTDEIADG